MISMIFLCFKNLGLRNVAIAQASPVARLEARLVNDNFFPGFTSHRTVQKLAFGVLTDKLSPVWKDSSEIHIKFNIFKQMLKVLIILAQTSSLQFIIKRRR